jgi:GNAT superfamily N-acetyltransferase
METQAPVQSYTTRTATADDQPLLFALFAADKREEFAALDLPADKLHALLEMQFRARDFTYASNSPGATDLILCLPDGTPTGRHLIQRNPQGWRSIDIAVLPEFRGRGIAAWSLRNLQSKAEAEGLAVTLRVVKANAPAMRLYQRLDFAPTSEDDVAFEMRWQPPNFNAPGAPPPPEPHDIPAMTGGAITRDQLIDHMTAFLRAIGLMVEFAPVASSSVPGIERIANGLRVDRDALDYPGDMLHEAGMLAVRLPEEREQDPSSQIEPAFQIAAIAWAWAAAFGLGIPDFMVIHDQGYKGLAPHIRADFAAGKCPGLPILAWIGMTTAPTPETPSIYPQMLHWLRPPAPSAAEPAA